MRIAFVVADFPCLSETFGINQVTGLIGHGHQADIYTNRMGNWAMTHPEVRHYRLWEHNYPMSEVPQNYLWRLLVQGIGLRLRASIRTPGLLARSLGELCRHSVQLADGSMYNSNKLTLWLCTREYLCKLCYKIWCYQYFLWSTPLATLSLEIWLKNSRFRR